MPSHQVVEDLPKNEPLERRTNLAFALLRASESGQRPVTVDWICKHIPGYARDANGVARKRETIETLFKRDRNSLAAAGVPIEEVALGAESSAKVGYRIQRDEALMESIEFTSEEATVLALAGKMGLGEELATFSRSGWTKIAASGVSSDLVPTPRFTPIGDDSKLTATDYQRIDLALRRQRRITFTYAAHVGAAPSQRTMQPWGMPLYRERWYLVGFDEDRQAPRAFRITRICNVGRPEPVDAPAPKPATSPRELVEAQLRALRTLVTATIEVTSPAASAEAGPLAEECAALTRHGQEIRPGVFSLVDVDRDWCVRMAARLAPAVVVTDPLDLREEVVALLRQAAEHAAGDRAEAVQGSREDGESQDTAMSTEGGAHGTGK